jgi:DNA-binding NtrC family response regulator
LNQIDVHRSVRVAPETFRAERRFDGMSGMKNPCTVLIVEDEPLVRMVAVELLQDAGFEVCEADHADKAIPVLEAQNTVRVLFTDVRMPGSMNGYALAHYVHGRWPNINIIVTSGHTRVRNDSLPPGAVFIPKPYDPDLLRQCVQKMIAA